MVQRAKKIKNKKSRLCLSSTRKKPGPKKKIKSSRRPGGDSQREETEHSTSQDETGLKSPISEEYIDHSDCDEKSISGIVSSNNLLDAACESFVEKTASANARNISVSDTDDDSLEVTQNEEEMDTREHSQGGSVMGISPTSSNVSLSSGLCKFVETMHIEEGVLYMSDDNDVLVKTVEPSVNTKITHNQTETRNSPENTMNAKNRQPVINKIYEAKKRQRTMDYETSTRNCEGTNSKKLPRIVEDVYLENDSRIKVSTNGPSKSFENPSSVFSRFPFPANTNLRNGDLPPPSTDDESLQNSRKSMQNEAEQNITPETEHVTKRQNEDNSRTKADRRNDSSSDSSCISFLAKMNLTNGDLLPPSESDSSQKSSHDSETQNSAQNVKEPAIGGSSQKSHQKISDKRKEDDGRWNYEYGGHDNDNCAQSQYTDEEYLDDDSLPEDDGPEFVDWERVLEEESEKCPQRNNVEGNKGDGHEFINQEELPDDGISGVEDGIDEQTANDDGLDGETIRTDPTLKPTRKPREKKKNCLEDAGLRNIVKIPFFFEQIQAFDTVPHRADCRLRHWKLSLPITTGFRVSVTLACSNCGVKTIVDSEPKNDDYLDVNDCAVLAINSIGDAGAALTEISANLGLNGMSDDMYQKLTVKIDGHFRELAEEQMKQNNEEERRIALEKKSVVGGYPACAVYGDGSWGVRSFGSGARSDCGMAVLIGVETKKVLYTGYGLNYCLVCMRAEKANRTPPEHDCWMNRSPDKSILSVEKEVIVDGFINSLTYDLAYNQYIADGDSSAYDAVLTADPYNGRVQIERLFCRLHIQRCRINEIRSIIKKIKTGRDEDIKALKKYLWDNLGRICRNVTSAAVHWRKQSEETIEDKVANLRTDILNIMNHILGDHSECNRYFCSRQAKLGEENRVPLAKRTKSGEETVSNALHLVMETWAAHAYDVLIGKTTNAAENYNSILAKLIGRKAKNVQLRGMYSARIAMATVQFNTQALASSLHQKLYKIVPSTITYMERQRQEKNVYNRKYKKNKRKRELPADETESMRKSRDYGRNPRKPDLSPEEYEINKGILNTMLNDWYAKPGEVEIITRGSNKGMIQRKRLLFSEFFGPVCRMRPLTPTATMVQRILYPGQQKKNHEQHIQRTKKRIRQEMGGLQECGVIINSETRFLATQPDALIGEDTILIIHCPYDIRKSTIEEAFKKSKNDINKIFMKVQNCTNYDLNRKSGWYYNIIGSLRIARRKSCIFVVSTETDSIHVNVEFNYEFWKREMENKLTSFYENHLLPEIVDSRKKRHMELRDNKRAKPSEEKNLPKRYPSNERGRSRLLIPLDTPNGPAVYCLPDSLTDINDRPPPVPLHPDRVLHELITEDKVKVSDPHGWLEDTHMDVFGGIMMNLTNNLYCYQSVSLQGSLEMIWPIDPLRKHVQILNRGLNHWVCAYYDTKDIFIYDSLLPSMDDPLGPFRDEYYEFLSRLLPNFNFEERGVRFPRDVQQQGNGSDCGLFAIAFAISLIHNEKPRKELRYDESKLRMHLAQLYENRSLEHFPLSNECTITIPNLEAALEKERQELRNRTLHNP